MTLSMPHKSFPLRNSSEMQNLNFAPFSSHLIIKRVLIFVNNHFTHLSSCVALLPFNENAADCFCFTSRESSIKVLDIV